MKSVIRLENISKAYQLGVFNSKSFRNDIKNWWKGNARNSNENISINGKNIHGSNAADSKIIWSLKDLNFDIYEGQSVGLIGRNGAGKSTLLKVLSQITHPTSGVCKIKGRVASLLEVGTGFHPELTGRDNIFLNGAILGMSRQEISRKFDEIVDFAGVEKYIDTPVKRYSSGMYVRLAFGVAAHLESDILIVDEVLAVGDADFQKKCLGKMNELGKGGGRTILFVSHNMSSVKSLCEKSIYLDKGEVQAIGDTNEIIPLYLNSYSPSLGHDGDIKKGNSLYSNGKAYFSRFIVEKKGTPCSEFFFGEKPRLLIELNLLFDIVDLVVTVSLSSIYGETIAMFTNNNEYKPSSLLKGKHTIEVDIDEIIMPGEYTFTLSMAHASNGETIDFIESVGKLIVMKESYLKDQDYPWNVVHGYIKPKSSWKFK